MKYRAVHKGEIKNCIEDSGIQMGSRQKKRCQFRKITAQKLFKIYEFSAEDRFFNNFSLSQTWI
jgi:hypothetical protein